MYGRWDSIALMPNRHCVLSDIFNFHPHPYGMRLKAEGLSHGLKTCHRHVFLTAFRVLSRTKKEDAKGVLFFGARDGTRTHTAVATRTSNVIVYHSNTLASAKILYRRD